MAGAGRSGRVTTWAVVLGIHLLGAAAGGVASQFGAPLPWVLGSLIVSAAATMAFNAPPPPKLTRRSGQLIVGAAIGLYLSPAELERILELAWPLAFATVSVLGVGLGVGLLQARLASVHPATAILSSIPGGAAEMATLAEEFGGDPAQTALAQTLRVFCIVSLFPFLLVASGAATFFPASISVNTDVPELLVLLGVGVVATILAGRLRLSNPSFLGPMFAVGVLTMAGIHLAPVPVPLVAMAQVLIGVSLGATMRRSLFRSGPAVLFWSMFSTVLLLGLCLVFAWLVTRWSAQDFGTMVLATAPGSVTEMSLAARAMHLDAAIVAAFHVVRVFATMVAISVVGGLLLRARRIRP